MRDLVLENQLLYGTVNAGPPAFDHAIARPGEVRGPLAEADTRAHHRAVPAREDQRRAVGREGRDQERDPVRHAVRGSGASKRGGTVADVYDVIIIGTGAGGGTLAAELAPFGKRILLLERGGWLPREQANWNAEDVFVDNRYVSKDTWYDKNGKRVSARRPLLRRRRDQDVRRRALPPARARLRRAPTPGRHLARLADLVRRDGAVLHARREPLPGARRARRGSHRAARERALSAPGGLARAAHPAAPRRSGAGRLPAVPHAVRHHAERERTCRSRSASAAWTATGSPAWSTPSRTRR